MGVTVLAPKASESSSESGKGEVMPAWVAIARVAVMPTSESSLMATVLIDRAKAVRSRTGPRKLSLS